MKTANRIHIREDMYTKMANRIHIGDNIGTKTTNRTHIRVNVYSRGGLGFLARSIVKQHNNQHSDGR